MKLETHKYNNKGGNENGRREKQKDKQAKKMMDCNMVQIGNREPQIQKTEQKYVGGKT